MWPRNVSHEAHVAQQCYRLQSLAQALREEEGGEVEEEGGGEGKRRRKKGGVG